MPPPVAAASARAIELALAEPELRVRLGDNARRLRGGLGRLGLDCGDSPAPIVCLSLGKADNMRRIQSALMERGILDGVHVRLRRTAQRGRLAIGRLRSAHAPMIDQLLDALAQAE